MTDLVLVSISQGDVMAFMIRFLLVALIGTLVSCGGGGGGGANSTSGTSTATQLDSRAVPCDPVHLVSACPLLALSSSIATRSPWNSVGGLR
jgi:hypothetical protein